MSAEEKVRIRRKNRWTQVMLEHLIKLWGKYYHELKVNSRGHDKVYAKIIEELAMVGCTASMDDIRGRIHNLSGKYRKELVTEAETGRRSQWPYYTKIGEFFEYSLPVQVSTNRPVLYDMSQYLELEYGVEDSVDLEGNGRVLIQEGEISDEEHLEDRLDDDEERLEVDEWQSEHLDDDDNTEEDIEEVDENKMEEDTAEGDEDNLDDGIDDEPDEPEEGPLVEVPPDEDDPCKEPSEHAKDPSEPAKEPSETDKDIPIKTPQKEVRASPEKQHTITRKEKEKSVESDGGSTAQAPTGKVYRLNSSYRQETIENFLSVLYSNRLYTDVTIVTCHNGDICTIPAHQFLLANFSPHFSRIFENLKSPATTGPVSLILSPDIPHAVMLILLEYMYTGGTDVPGEVIDDVLRCGTQLRIRGFWSENKGEATVKRPTEIPPDSTKKKARLDADDSSRSSTPSSPAYEPIRNAKKPTCNMDNDDDDDHDVCALTEVSSEIGFDLLRSDDDEEQDDEDEDDEDGGDDDDEYDYASEDDENTNDEDDDDDEQGHDDDDEDEDYDDDDDEDEKDYDDDRDDDTVEEERQFGKQDKHKAKRMEKIFHQTSMQAEEKRANEQQWLNRKRRLDTANCNGESNGQHGGSTRDPSPAEKRPQHAAQDGVSKRSNPVKPRGSNLFCCKICPKRFAYDGDWLDHVVEAHSSDSHILERDSSDDHITMLQCDLCQKYQASKRSWLQHVLLKHAE